MRTRRSVTPTLATPPWTPLTTRRYLCRQTALSLWDVAFAHCDGIFRQPALAQRLCHRTMSSNVESASW